jgi:hypothetical protein
MAVSDGLISVMETKHHYVFWRPITAIRSGDTDGNSRTQGDPTWAPFITTPCFPSYPSAHASASYAGRTILEKTFGPGDQDITRPGHPGRDSPLHQVLTDHGGHRRCTRLRRIPLPLRSRSGGPPGTPTTIYAASTIPKTPGSAHNHHAKRTFVAGFPGRRRPMDHPRCRSMDGVRWPEKAITMCGSKPESIRCLTPLRRRS